MKSLKNLSIIAVVLLLVGCGFHMRGAYNIPKEFQVLKISPNQPYDEFQRALKRTLKYNQVTVVDATVAHEYRTANLIIQKQTFKERIVAYGGDGQATRSISQLTINYQLVDPNGKVVVSDGVIRVERDLSVNPRRVLGTDNEREMVRGQLVIDAADRFVWQVSIIPTS